MTVGFYLEIRVNGNLEDFQITCMYSRHLQLSGNWYPRSKSADTWSTVDQHLDRHSIDTISSLPKVGWVWTDSYASIQNLLPQPTVNWDVNWESIDSQPQMTLVHIIQIFKLKQTETQSNESCNFQPHYARGRVSSSWVVQKNRKLMMEKKET